MIPTTPATLYQRVCIVHFRASGNAMCWTLNRDGTFRVLPFMLYADPKHNQPTRGTK